MASKYIPNYSKYSLYGLVDVYRRIDRQRNPENVKLIEEQIRIKMNLPGSTDLNDEGIQKQFDEIISENNPVSVKKRENEETSDTIKMVEYACIIAGIVIMVIALRFETLNEKFGLLGFGLMGMGLAAELLQSIFTNEISLKGSTFTKSEQPFMFGCSQFMIAVLIIIIFLAILRNMFR